MHLHLGVEGLLPLSLYCGMWAAFALSVFWRPAISIYVLAFALPMQTGRYKIHDMPLGAEFVDLMMLGAILGLMRAGKPIIPKTPLSRFLLIFAIFYYFSLWEGAFFINAPLPFWITDARCSDWKNYVEMLLFAPVVAGALATKKQIKVLLIVTAMSVLVVNRNYYYLMAGRDLSHFSYDVRDAGLLGYAGVNGLAAFEAMFMAYLLSLLVTVQGIVRKLAISAVLVTCAYCLLFSFSRGGYVAFLCAMLVLGLLKSRVTLVSAIIIFFSWQIFLPVAVQERITMTTGDAAPGEQLDSSAQERLVLWRDALDLFQRNPLTGTGFETYQFMGRVGPYKDTHNYYLKVIAETGVVGMLLFLMLLRRLWSLGYRLFRAGQDPFWQSIGLAFVVLVSTSIVLNFFGDRWTYQQVDGYLWIFLGCVLRGLMYCSDQMNEQAQKTGNSSCNAGEVDHLTPALIHEV